ncbi:amidohydrolase [Streptomyces iconiensis]|uniref:Amidohydrolase family protein n=1 Tax=Streptomyces iconiensis TaxID=1384038 RepID=A0ABT7A5C1_9ACTN|nr:amidohydrolase [Streptomyces iconiensis]MDJ1136506.1 amidohydrolase family protein [Streptomyces iconiensis]
MAVPTEPDLIVRGGVVLTLDGAGRRVSALAARGGRITALGDDREISALAGPHTRVLELEGRTAIPGFIESHNHPVFFGFALAAPVDAGSPPNDRIADIAERLAVAVREAPAGEWVRGFRYDHTLLADRRHPTRHDLDPVSPRHPVVLTHVTGHFCTVNSAALALLGITAATPDPPGGRIERDASGEATGVLVETAAFLVNSQLPRPDEETLAHALRLADREFLANGITTVHDTGTGLFGGTGELALYRRLSASGELRTRVRSYLAHQAFAGADGRMPTPGELGAASDGERFRLAGVKIIADGSIQGRTGCLAEGYHQHPDEHGMMLQSPERLAEMVADVDAAGWQAAVHGNGDAAIEAIVGAYRHVDSAARRHRIEHCQTVREDQLDRMAEQGVLASFFVKHVYYWGDGHRDLWLGPERARRISPLVSAHRRGIIYGLHSDTPVTPVPPLEGVWCAVARRTRDGHELGPEQAVDVERALRAYTVDAAHLTGEEGETGTLEAGKLADLAVLSDDPTAVTTEALRTLRVEATVVGGEVAWSATGELSPAL